MSVDEKVRDLPKEFRARDPLTDEQSLFIHEGDGIYCVQGDNRVYDYEEVLEYNDNIIRTERQRTNPSCAGKAYLTNVGGGYDRED